MKYILNISLVDVASFVFLLGSSIIIVRMSLRTGKSVLSIIFGLERNFFFLSATTKEKIFIAVLFVFFFILSFLWIQGISTIGDLLAKL